MFKLEEEEKKDNNKKKQMQYYPCKNLRKLDFSIVLKTNAQKT